MDLLDEVRLELAGKIEHERAKGNLVDSFTRAQMAKDTIVTNFPKILPPPGIEYSRNFQGWQNHGMFAVQVQG